MGTNEIAEALGIPAGPSGLQSDDPYPMEVPVRVRGLAGSGNLGADSICEPFLEDTLTVLVSARGAVLRLAAHASPGQMLTLSSPRLGREMPARVIRYRGHADVKGYAEIEFAPEAATPGAAPASASAISAAAPEAASPASPSLVIAPLADLLTERPNPPRARRSYEPLDPPMPPANAKQASAPARTSDPRLNPRPRVAAQPPKPAPQPQKLPTKTAAAPDLEALLTARKTAEQAVVEAQPPAQETAQRLFEPGALAAFAEPRRPRKRWLAIAAATVLTVGAVGAWAVVTPVEAMGPLPEIAAFALPGPPEVFASRNEVRFLAREKFETVSMPIATHLTPPASSLKLNVAAPQMRVVAKQRVAAEATEAPEIHGAETSPAGAARPGVLGALAPLGASGQPAPPPMPPVGGVVVQPRLISQAPVVYPHLARMTRAEGNVVIDARIDETGRVTEMRIISGSGVFHQAAKESLAQWRYQPALLNGKPIATHLYVTIQFKR